MFSILAMALIPVAFLLLFFCFQLYKTTQTSRRISIVTYGEIGEYKSITEAFLSKYATIIENNIELSANLPSKVIKHKIIVLNRITARIEEFQEESIQKLASICQHNMIIFHLKVPNRQAYTANGCNSQQINLNIHNQDEHLLRDCLSRFLEISVIEHLNLALIKIMKVIVILSLVLVFCYFGKLTEEAEKAEKIKSLLMLKSDLSRYNSILKSEILNKVYLNMKTQKIELADIREVLKKEQIVNTEKFEEISSQIQNMEKEKVQILEEHILLNKTLNKLKHDYNILNEDKMDLSSRLDKALAENELLSQRVAKLEENERKFDEMDLSSKLNEALAENKLLSERIAKLEDERKFIIRREEFQPNKPLPSEANIPAEGEGILNQALSVGKKFWSFFG